VININPQNHEMKANYWVHKNIRIEHNTFKVYESLILSAQSTSGLYFTNNKIELTAFLISMIKTSRKHIFLVTLNWH
jgi:hypothetical protein